MFVITVQYTDGQMLGATERRMLEPDLEFLYEVGSQWSNSDGNDFKVIAVDEYVKVPH